MTLQVEYIFQVEQYIQVTNTGKCAEIISTAWFVVACHSLIKGRELLLASYYRDTCTCADDRSTIAGDISITAMAFK